MDPIKLTFTPSAPKKLGTVFIVDDNAVEREMLMDYFEKYPNLVVKGFTSGEECVKEIVISGVSPDIILMDYFLDSEVASSKDGLEMLVKLKEISPATSIIMYTSVENERVVDLARQKGAFGYVVKGPAGFEMLDYIIETEFRIIASPEGNA